MKITNEQLKKARMTKSVEELMTYAKEIGIDLTTEKAKKYFDYFQNNLSISDDELANVSGGCGKPKPKFKIGEYVYWAYPGQSMIYSGTILDYEWKKEQKMYDYAIACDQVPEVMRTHVYEDCIWR